MSRTISSAYARSKEGNTKYARRPYHHPRFQLCDIHLRRRYGSKTNAPRIAVEDHDVEGSEGGSLSKEASGRGLVVLPKWRKRPEEEWYKPTTSIMYSTSICCAADHGRRRITRSFPPSSYRLSRLIISHISQQSIAFLFLTIQPSLLTLVPFTTTRATAFLSALPETATRTTTKLTGADC
jgi:hypothetical protein